MEGGRRRRRRRERGGAGAWPAISIGCGVLARSVVAHPSLTRVLCLFLRRIFGEQIPSHFTSIHKRSALQHGSSTYLQVESRH
jgi:hypothetical protein